MNGGEEVGGRDGGRRGYGREERIWKWGGGRKVREDEKRQVVIDDVWEVMECSNERTNRRQTNKQSRTERKNMLQT